MIKKVEAFEYNGILFKTKEEIDNHKLNDVRKELLNYCWFEEDCVSEEESLDNILNILISNKIFSEDKFLKIKEINKIPF